MVKSALELETIPLGASKLAVTAARLSQLLRAEHEHALAQRGDLTLIEWHICLALSQGASVSQKALVDFTRAQQAQVSRALFHLHERGLIRSWPSDNDRRSKLYALAERGSAHLTRNMPALISLCDRIDAALTPAELAKFIELSERIARVAQEDPAGVQATVPGLADAES